MTAVPSARETIANLEAEAAAERSRADHATAHLDTVTAVRAAEIKRALEPHLAADRALWWLLAQTGRDPRPLTHDPDCWLRHLGCFADRLRSGGGPQAVAQELAWARQRWAREQAAAAATRQEPTR